MTAGPPDVPDAPEVLAATRTLNLLRAQADGLRAEIVQMQRQLAGLHRDFEEARITELVVANSQLVLSVLRAEAVAETAAGELEELTRSSQRDELTGTPNRASMLGCLQSAIALARRHGTLAAVLFLDLDRFKQINDSLGHAAGDEVLKLTARRLESALRHSDTVSRHSGDEFLILLADVIHVSDAAAAATKMLQAIAEPSRVGDRTLHLSASIGIAIYPRDGEEVATLIARADAAMYRAKQHGRGVFSFYVDGVSGSAEAQAR